MRPGGVDDLGERRLDHAVEGGIRRAGRHLRRLGGLSGELLDLVMEDQRKPRDAEQQEKGRADQARPFVHDIPAADGPRGEQPVIGVLHRHDLSLDCFAQNVTFAPTPHTRGCTMLTVSSASVAPSV